MNGIRLSICIPTYNFGEFIGETLKSVTDQARNGVEIIVVDGASTDNTAEIVRDFQRRFPTQF
jgi:abequosyltransferase